MHTYKTNNVLEYSEFFYLFNKMREAEIFFMNLLVEKAQVAKVAWNKALKDNNVRPKQIMNVICKDDDLTRMVLEILQLTDYLKGDKFVDFDVYDVTSDDLILKDYSETDWGDDFYVKRNLLSCTNEELTDLIEAAVKFSAVKLQNDKDLHQLRMADVKNGKMYVSDGADLESSVKRKEADKALTKAYNATQSHVKNALDKDQRTEMLNKIFS